MMDFPSYNFDTLNETDVREEIIAPLIRHLGYRAGSEHDVLREQTLTYEASQLGRRKPNDPPLRGRADYICVAGGRVRWIIEAKGPDQAIDSEAQAQAWSYANHPEVRAVYFALTNGREFKLFVTNRGPTAAQLFEFSYAEFASNLLKIENTLRPENVLRDHPEILVDAGPPLAPGLRSTARITGGQMTISRVSLDALQPLKQLTNTITTGSVERRHDGTIYVYYEAKMPIRAVQQANQLVGFGEVELFSAATSISADEGNPTILYGGQDVTLKKGMELYDVLQWKSSILTTQIDANVSWLARGYLRGHTFHGTYDSALFLRSQPVQAVIEIGGTFEVNLV
ncbi:type I restriction enzyme HsdR N-terminal domain-containing protein [uncultured Variovorax sp.]|uniref:type I restriction enzyme HsdR N-terminal domain-containing protein n=1 Tax=uncultured Variovorax sp. TaxID=114708 RepID=UPI0025D5A1A0|nr:type I restriction enzyme HsdR N-terminal domain-containing protein [uncultured Variovorax sp.]